jgi:hypothetical protein
MIALARWIETVSAMMVSALLLLALVPSGAQAQGENSYVTGNDQTITWSASWEIDRETIFQSNDGDSISLTNGPWELTVTVGDRSVVDSSDMLIEYMFGAETMPIGLEADTDGTYYWWLYAVSVDGVELGMYIRQWEIASSDLVAVTAIVGPAADFAHGLAMAQTGVEMDGVPLFEGISGRDLRVHFEKGREAHAVSEATAEASKTTLTPDGVPYADAGMVEEGHYISPQFGVEVRWGPAWGFDPYQDPAVTSFPEMGSDRLDISWVEDDWVTIGVHIFSADGKSMEETIEYWSSEAALVLYYSPDVEVVLSKATLDRGAVVYRTTDPITWPATVYYTEYRLVNDGTVYVGLEMMSNVASLEQGLHSAQDHVTIDGEAAMTYFPVEHVVAAVGQ